MAASLWEKVKNKIKIMEAQQLYTLYLMVN